MTAKVIESFVDTNILVYSVDLSRPNRQYHRASLKILRQSESQILCLSPQILGKFYAVMTSSSAVNNPISPIWRNYAAVRLSGRV
jgi:predicted nucleic acid-binding protein